MAYFMYKKENGKVISKLFSDDEKAGKEWVDCPTKTEEKPKKKESK